MKKLLALLFFLSACTYVDTGQIDYRVADVPGPITDLNLRPSACRQDLSARDCETIRPARVDRRYEPDPNTQAQRFATSDVYSISIDQIQIGNDLLEGIVLGREYGRAGEFAVLAHAFEFAANASEADQRRFVETGLDPNNARNLRLIHFEGDVRRNQPLNFSRTVLLPRTSYQGRSIGIQIVIMEVDVSSAPARSLLSTLADMGKVALPASQPLDLLFNLGRSFFDGSRNTDDRIFEYRFVLSAPGADNQAVRGTFAPGRYILRRSRDRARAIDWSNVRLDHNTGRLYRQPLANARYEEIRDELYVVLDIDRFSSSAGVEHYTQQNWGEARDALQRAVDARDAPLSALQQNLQDIASRGRSADWRSRLAGRWEAVEAALRHYERRALANISSIDLTGCTTTHAELERQRDLARQTGQIALRAFVAEYQAAVRRLPIPAGGQTEPEISATDREAVIAQVARYFMPWTPAAGETLFTNAQTFENNFITSATDDLIARALAVTEGRTAPVTTCAGLISSGLSAPSA